MRLVIDLQAAQGMSAGRGMGRYSKALALGMIRDPGPHEPVVLLNAALEDGFGELHDELAAPLPRGNLRVWRSLTHQAACGGPASMARRRASETIRAQVLAGLAPDLIHVASVCEGGGDDVVSTWPAALERLPQAATFYDAIPLIHRERYLNGTWKGEGAHWYLRQVQEFRHCSALLAISQSSRREAIEHLGIPPERVHAIMAGYDPIQFRPQAEDAAGRAALLRRLGLREGFILFVGAGDLRKNEDGLLRAYARLPAALRARHQLAIVGARMPGELRQRAAALGIATEALALIPHLAEADLPRVYAACHVFVLPSWHEGFGLPALEAMACGAAVLASNATSLPEVVGLAEALFDPHDPDAMAARIAAVLHDESFRRHLIAHGLRRAPVFSWARSAALAWAALEQAADALPKRPSAAVAARKPRLAWVGPLPPDESGIADYAADLLPDLDRHYDITLVSRSGATSDPTLDALFDVIDEAAFSHRAGRFDRILYQVGNSHFHRDMLRDLLPCHPGVVVLHDAFLSNLPLLDHLAGGARDGLALALLESHGWGAVAGLDGARAADAMRPFPCTLPVFRAALGVIHHSAHAREISVRHVGPEAAAMIRIVPHARAPWRGAGRLAARERLGLAPNTPVVCSFGIVHATKRPSTVLHAWRTAFGHDPAARLAFVGPCPPDVRLRLATDAARLGVGESVLITGRLDQDSYRLWLEAADIAVQLRTDSRGETSGAVADAMAAGLPVLVSRHGAMAELPPGAVGFVADNAGDSAVGEAIAALWDDPAHRAALGRAASRHVRQALSPERAALLCRDAIEHFHAQGRPAHLRAATPELSAFDLPDAAHALARSFPDALRPRLLVDAAAAAQEGTLAQEFARFVLAHPGPPATAELARLDTGPARLERREAARLLGIALHVLPEPRLLGAEADTLLLPPRATPWPPSALVEIDRLRRAGTRVAALIDTHAALAPTEPVLDAIALADAVLCETDEAAVHLRAWLDTGCIPRRRPLDLHWPDRPAEAPEVAGPADIDMLIRPDTARQAALARLRDALAPSAARQRLGGAISPW